MPNGTEIVNGARSHFTCRVEHVDRATVVRLGGQIDLAGAAKVRSSVLKELATQPAAIIFDLTWLTSGDDLYLTVLPAMARHGAAWPGCPVVFYGASRPVRKALRGFGLQRQARMCPGWDDAVAESRRPAPSARIVEHYPPIPISVTAARLSAMAACERWSVPTEIRERIEVVLAELVTNAVRHAGTRIEMTVRLSENYVHVAVRDGDHRLPRLSAPETVYATSGRGLLIVDGFATAWGTTPTDDGKVVWATVRHRGLR